MHPLAVITGILLGTAVAITLGLAVVVLLFFILAGEYPRLTSELMPLLESTALFVVMTVVSAFSFIGVLRRRPWRWYAQTAMWLGVLLIALYYWPD